MTKLTNYKGEKLTAEEKTELKEIRLELKIIRDSRRELLKAYRYWKRKEYQMLNF